MPLYVLDFSRNVKDSYRLLLKYENNPDSIN